MVKSSDICCVPNCDKTREANVILHKFPSPLKEWDRFRSWIYSIGGDVLALANESIYKYGRVCHIHFEQIYVTGGGTLTNIAVPTLRLKGASATIYTGKGTLYGEFHSLYEELRGQPLLFKEYCRVLPATFDYLVQAIKPALSMKATNFQRPISVEERLMVTLRLINASDLLYQESKIGESINEDETIHSCNGTPNLEDYSSYASSYAEVAVRTPGGTRDTTSWVVYQPTMADEIDIEEHDVLESLRRRQQLEDPDVTIVKSEPLKVEYEESNDEESNYEWESDKQQQPMEIEVAPHTDNFRFGKIILGSKSNYEWESDKQQQPMEIKVAPHADKFRFGKIILGSKSNYEWESDEQQQPVEIKVAPHADKFRFGKIILGSKSNYEWESDEQQPVEIKVAPHADKFRFGKIILGSKPAEPENHPPTSDIQLDEENYNYNMSLVLDDWGPMLDNSDCYCKECRILFATVNALDAHTMIAHSFLVTTDEQPSSPERNKPIKSTAKPAAIINQGRDRNEGSTCGICNKNYAGHRSNLRRHYRTEHQLDQMTIENNMDSKTWRMCNHCKKYFPDDTSLVKHLYELLPKGNTTPTKDEKKSAGQSTLKTKPALNVDKGPKANTDIKQPTKLSNCLKANKMPRTKRDWEEHEEIHQTTGRGIQTFRIVAFNDENDTDANKTIMSYDTENYGSNSKISFTDEELPSKAPLVNPDANTEWIVFYKCAVCYTSIRHLRNHKLHVCNVKQQVKCAKCGILTHKNKIQWHMGLHQKYSFSRNNVILKTFHESGMIVNIRQQSPEKKTSIQQKLNNAEPSKLYKCYCGLHYTSLKSIEEHYKLKNCNTVIREKCSQCDLLFEPIEVVNHLCKHHAQNQVKTFNVVMSVKKTLYKCGICHVLFYNQAAALPHKAKCVGKLFGTKCEQCGLAFDATSIATHMVDHERNNKLKTDCYAIVKIPDPTTTVADRRVPPNTLYKCTRCEIHFLKRSIARVHQTKIKDCTNTQTEICRICKLKFPRRSIPKHVTWQHNELKIKDFKIIEVFYAVNNSCSW